MSGEQTGIVWKRMPNMASGGSGPAGDPSTDYSNFGARLTREFVIEGGEGETSPVVAGSVLTVYEMPAGLLKHPTPIELQLFEPPLYLPETPTTPVRQAPRIGRIHARVFYSIGNSGQMRLDCDWLGSVPIVAHKSLIVQAVMDRYVAGSDPDEWDAAFVYSDSTDDGDPGDTMVSFDTPFPEVGTPLASNPPGKAYLSRVGADSPPPLFVPPDAGDFASTHDPIVFQLGWGSTAVRFAVSAVVVHDTYVEFTLAGLAIGSATTMLEALGNGDPVIVRFDDVTERERIELNMGVLIGERPPKAPPTYTFPTVAVDSQGSASFPVPAQARKLRCALRWGEESGSTPDAPLGQYFFAFINRSFGPLGWIDAASAREALFGDGVFVPPGTHAVQFDNRSPDAARVTACFVLGL